MLDLACGTGEMVCTWARDHQVTGTGIDISTVFIAAARTRGAELGVDGRVSFVLGDASGYVAAAPVFITSCIGATWIGGGVPGTVELLRHSLQPGGMKAPASQRHTGTYLVTTSGVTFGENWPAR
jgi:SAM-dependent methyltransferase